MLFTCQAGFQDLLAEELADFGFQKRAEGPGWLWTEAPSAPVPEVAFAHAWIADPKEYAGESVNALAGQLATAFLEGLRGQRIEAAWPCLFWFPAEIVGLGRRVGAVESAFLELVKKKLSRVAKLATPELPRGGVGPVRGWGVYFIDFGRVLAGPTLWANGPRRMADDERAPSRSYLKVEEAYGLLGREPQTGETVVDLGAAPGGWSFSAAKRGARVIAVDNGPLKGGALDHPQIEHRREDAFGFKPAVGERFDWLYCDLVEDPHHVLENLVAPWLQQRWCRRFVINLKFGRVAPVPFLRTLREARGVFAQTAPGFRVRHLFHDREEFTVAGEVAE